MMSSVALFSMTPVRNIKCPPRMTSRMVAILIPARKTAETSVKVKLLLQNKNITKTKVFQKIGLSMGQE